MNQVESVVEQAPEVNVPEENGQALYEAAVEKIKEQGDALLEGLDADAKEEAPAGEQAKSKFVEMTPEVQERFNKIYGYMKEYEEKYENLRKHNEILEMSLQKINETQERSSTETAMAQVRKDMKEAFENGETERYLQLSETLSDLKAEAKIREVLPKQEKEVAAQQVQPTPYKNLKFDNNDVARIDSWALERGEDGQLLRPWANDDQRTVEALEFADYLKSKDPAMPLDDLLAKVERHMMASSPKPAPKKVVPVGAAAVLSGDLQKPQNNAKVQLTDAQRQIARKMGLSPERYAKQLMMASQV